MLQLLRNDGESERAVSPVIGVILMVAITVILAAVIASFVLGLGDSAAEPAPTPTMDVDVDGDEFELSMTGGGDFDSDVVNIDLEVVHSGDNVDVDDQLGGLDIESESGVESGNNDFNGETTAGDSLELTVDGDEIESWEVTLVWNPADSDSEIIFSDES